jgi:general secretion pathway protein L
MDKRLIGIEIDNRFVRVAIFTQDRDGIELAGIARRPYGGPEELTAVLQELIGETRLYSDRLATAVPALDSFVRWLHFPFSDPKKIAAALPFELAAQLPVGLEEYTTDFRKPVADEQGGFAVTASATRTEGIERLVDTFDHAHIPLHIIDLSPFALAAGLRQQYPDGILVCLTAQETTLSLLSEGQIVDFRLSPPPPGEADAAATARHLLREKTMLQRDAGLENLPMYLMGSGVTPELTRALAESGEEVLIPSFSLDGETVAAEYLPAVALALRAALPVREREFNYRHGRFALKNEWASIKKEITAAALVLLMALVALAGSAYLSYSHKSERAENLRQEMVRIYRDTFPGAQAIVDIPLQMTSRINELKTRGRQIGVGGQHSSLAVIKEISQATPNDLTVDIRDLAYTHESVRLEGVTSSFDAVNRMARSLEQSTMFREAQIADAKMSIDGSRIDFRINLTFNGDQIGR